MNRFAQFLTPEERQAREAFLADNRRRENELLGIIGQYVPEESPDDGDAVEVDRPEGDEEL